MPLVQVKFSTDLPRVVLEAGIYISHIVWRIRYRKLRQEAKVTGKSIDDLLAMQRSDPEETRDVEAGVLDQGDGTKDFKGSTRAQSPIVPSVERSEMSEKC